MGCSMGSKLKVIKRRMSGYMSELKEAPTDEKQVENKMYQLNKKGRGLMKK